MKAVARTMNVVALDRILDPLIRCLTPGAARALADLRADGETQARIAQLADRCNEGSLTEAERGEYEAYVRAIDLVAILQSKARRIAAGGHKR